MPQCERGLCRVGLSRKLQGWISFQWQGVFIRIYHHLKLPRSQCTFLLLTNRYHRRGECNRSTTIICSTRITFPFVSALHFRWGLLGVLPLWIAMGVSSLLCAVTTCNNTQPPMVSGRYTNHTNQPVSFAAAWLLFCLFSYAPATDISGPLSSHHHGYRLDDVMVVEAELAAAGSEVRQKRHVQGICSVLFGCFVRRRPVNRIFFPSWDGSFHRANRLLLRKTQTRQH